MSEWILKLRVPMLALALVLTALGGWAYDKLEYETSVESMVLSDDPDLLANYRMKDVFGADDTVIVAVDFSTSLFTPENLDLLEQLREEIATISGVEEATALTNLKIAHFYDDALHVEEMAKEIPKTQEEADALAKEAFRHPPYIGALFSIDKRVGVVVVEVPEPDEENPDIYEDVVEGIRARVKRAPFDHLPIHLAGPPALKHDLATYQHKDRNSFTLITLVVLLVLLYLSFRSFSATLLPLIAVQVGGVWLMGWIFLIGERMSMVNNILPPLTLVIGVAITIHVIITYYEMLGRGFAKMEALSRTISHLWLPCAMTTITTAGGFMSLSIAEVLPVRKFGLFATVGVVLMLFVGLVVVPQILSFLPTPKACQRQSLQEGFVRRMLVFISHLCETRPKTILLVSAFLLLAALSGVPKLRVETRLIEYFHKSAPIRVASDFINSHLSGASPFDITLRVDEETLDEKGGMYDPELLRRIERLQNWLKNLPEIDNPLSVTDFYKEIHRALQNDDDAFYRLPDSRAMAAQFMLLYRSSGGMEKLEKILSPSNDEARISARLKVESTSRLIELIDLTKKKTAEIFEGYPVEVHVTGTSVLYANMVVTLLRGQIASLLLAFIVISVAMVFVTRSLKLGLVAMLPNVLPVLMNLGLMGWMGISLNVATTMIGSVAIGIAVDDTIHFVTRFRREMEHTRDRKQAIARTFTTTGRAILFTSVVLVCGFWVLLASNFTPTAWFGLLSGMTVFLALLADLFLTPSLIHLIRFEKKEDPT